MMHVCECTYQLHKTLMKNSQFRVESAGEMVDVREGIKSWKSEEDAAPSASVSHKWPVAGASYGFLGCQLHCPGFNHFIICTALDLITLSSAQSGSQTRSLVFHCLESSGMAFC